ncbi:MAG TPA: hypothetical protein VGS28_03795 [Candidatus Saccharimonadales bacterium]|nr:hypothetical protein [Candidatus Saccharimonadales bacterium]
MSSIQKEMGPISRSFSRFIHIGPVEILSDITSRSLARPTALLIGGITAFFGLFSLYLAARDNGFALRGSEFYVLFAAGWIVGIAIDLGRILLGKTRSDA